MTEVQELAWDEVDVDETITETDQATSENLVTETPVGRFVCDIEACTAQENNMKAYSCIAANLKMKIVDVLTIEQPVIDDKGNPVKRNGDQLYKKMEVAVDQKAGINTLYAGRFLFDLVNMHNPKEKEGMKKRRLFVAKKIGIISPQANNLSARDWAGAPGRRVVVETEWNSWKDKDTDEIRKNVKVAWGGYDYAPAIDMPGQPVDDDFSNI